MSNSPTPPPSPRPSPDNRSKMLIWLGCASFLLIVLLVAVGITMMVMLRRSLAGSGGEPRAVRLELTIDWRARLHALREVPPEGLAFAPRRDRPGNAFAALRDAALPQPFPVAYMRLARGLAEDSGDASEVARLRRDTSADRIAAAAQLDQYHAVPLMVSDTTAAVTLFGVRTPFVFRWRVTFRAVELLIARGVARSRGGQNERARADLRAAIGLGLMMFEREPSIEGSAQGLHFAADAASALRQLSGTADPATARAAERLAAWGERVRADEFRLMGELSMTPDSLLQAATDTALPFPVRAEAIHGGTIAGMMRGPWSVFRGPPRAALSVVRSVEHDRDPDVAALALAYDSVLVQLDRVGGWGRLRFYLHGQR